MAKNPNPGKCVHCLSDPVERSWDHVFPKSWYPDATPENLEKWQIPSCVPCNNRYSKIEGDLLGRVGLALDANNPASAGIGDAALRAIKPAAGRNERDAALRAARDKKIAGEMLRGEKIPQDAVVPGLGERWNRPVAEQMAVNVPADSLRAMTEKIVRGLVYKEDNAFIEPPYKIDCFVVDDEGAKECVALLDASGKTYKREPGLEIRRAVVAGDERSALYEINFWQQFKTYASVSKQEANPKTEGPEVATPQK
jgi:hypothetical protein